MSYTRFVVINCDIKSEYCAWGNDPIQGEPDQTVSELLREAGWITRNGQHICPQCQYPELKGMPHPNQLRD